MRERERERALSAVLTNAPELTASYEFVCNEKAINVGILEVFTH